MENDILHQILKNQELMFNELKELKHEVQTVKDTTFRMEIEHGDKLQALYEGYINNQQSIQSQHEPRISEIENTVERHSLEILALKNAN